MAKVKARPDLRARGGYEEDFFAWTQEQAQILLNGRFLEGYLQFGNHGNVKDI